MDKIIFEQLKELQQIQFQQFLETQKLVLQHQQTANATPTNNDLQKALEHDVIFDTTPCDDSNPSEEKEIVKTNNKDNKEMNQNAEHETHTKYFIGFIKGIQPILDNAFTTSQKIHNRSMYFKRHKKMFVNRKKSDEPGAKVYDILKKNFLMYGDSTPKNISKDELQTERRWRYWADSTLVHLISPNVYRNRKVAFETFEWFSQAGECDVYFPKWERDMMVYVGANAMWLISKRLKKRHQLSDDVRSHIYDALNEWTNDRKEK